MGLGDQKKISVPKAIKAMDKKKSITKLKKELDMVFNAFIRKRDSKNGYFTCISSGKILSVKQMQAGHYFSCKFMPIRWDETNVNGQSISENIFSQGNFSGYTKGMIKKYGQKAIDILEAKKNNKMKMSAFEYEFLIKEYKEKISQLK